MSGRPITNSDGTSRPAAGDSTDAAALLQRIEELERSLANASTGLEHAQRLSMLGTLLGMIAHELNNILTPVLSYAQLALSKPEDRVLAERALRRAASGVENASKITAAILAFAREDDPKPAGPSEPAEVYSVLREALESLTQLPGTSLLEIRTEVPVGLRVHLDPLLLRQVLVNVLQNAAQAMEGRHGRITVRAAASSAANCSTGNTPTVQIMVEDSGPGIPAEALPRLFTPFATASTSRGEGSRRGGTGLGLLICKRIVESVGGRIGVESSPAGTRLFITLRVAA